MNIDLTGIPGHINEADIQAIEYIANQLPDQGIVVEFGTFFGKSAICWAKALRNLNKNYKIYTLDGFALSPKSIMKNSTQDYLLQDRKSVWEFMLGEVDQYTMACKILKDFPEIEIVKYNLFLDSSNILGLEEVTCFFNDGNHTGPGVKLCYEYWYPKVISGGYFCGHDYGNPRYIQVEKETNDFAETNKLEVIQPYKDSSVFYIKKPESSKT